MVFLFICIFLRELELSGRDTEPAHNGPIRFDLQQPGASKSESPKAGADCRLSIEGNPAFADVALAPENTGQGRLGIRRSENMISNPV